jgi:hypothetical protein
MATVTATKSAQSNMVETLEDRQMFSAMGTMNLIDAGVAPSLITSYTLNGVKDYADAGVSNWTRSATNPGTFAGSPTPGEKFGVFCLEPDQEFPSGTNVPYTVIDLDSDPTNGPMGAAKANAIRELWGRFRTAIGNDGTKAAAFQIAVWEIVTDSGRDLSTGVFRAGTANASEVAIKNQAQSWLNQLNGAGHKANLLALSSATDQDQVFEIPTLTPLQRGQAATIGFWHNKNGQALINSLNGGASATNLGNWLATNFPNLWGANAGPNNLAGKTNAQIAAYYLTKFNITGQKLDAQILSVAFATYATNTALAGNVAAKYGFKVDAMGTGSATINIGAGGAAFGVANNSNLSVWQILRATDQFSAGGTGASRFDIYNGNQALRNLANTIYSYINEHGDIL